MRKEQTFNKWVWLGIVLFVFWLFYSLSAYYVVQKPFSPTGVAALAAGIGSWLRFTFSLRAILRSLLDVTTAVWITAIALGVGLWLLAGLRLKPASILETTLFATGLGFGALGLTTLTLGLAGALDPAVFYGLAIILTLISLPRLLPHLRRWRWQGTGSRLLGAYLALIVVLTLFVTLLPPTSWDGLFYHLQGPRLYLDAGQIQPGIDIPHLNFPALFEMLFLMAMALRGDVAAKLLHFVFVFMLSGLVFALGRQFLQLRNGWTAVFFLLAAPMTLTLGSWAYNDLALAFYQVAAVYALLRWRQQQQRSWLILSGILCGLAMGLKYTSFMTPLFLAGVVIWTHQRQWRLAIRPFLLLTVTTSLVALPWYLKNLMFTGNPTYPFAFGGRYGDDFRAAAYAAPGSGIGFNLVALLRLPHDLMLGLQDASADVATGPLFLMFLPLLLVYVITSWRRRLPPAFPLLMGFVLLQYLFWMWGVISAAGLWQSRLLLPAFVILCPLLAWLWQDVSWLDHPQFSLRRFLNLTMGLAVVLGLLSQVLSWLPRSPWNYVWGSDTRTAVLRRDLGLHYQTMTELDDHLPPGATVAFLWEPRSYYCPADCRPDSILDTFAHLEYLYDGDAGAIAAAWREQGITHVLIFETGLDFMVAAGTLRVAPQDESVLDELRQTQWQAIYDWKGVYTLYELNG